MAGTNCRLEPMERELAMVKNLVHLLVQRVPDLLLTLAEVNERLGWTATPERTYRYTRPAAKTKTGRLVTVRKGRQLFLRGSSFNECKNPKK